MGVVLPSSRLKNLSTLHAFIEYSTAVVLAVERTSYTVQEERQRAIVFELHSPMAVRAIM